MRINFEFSIKMESVLLCFGIYQFGNLMTQQIIYFLFLSERVVVMLFVLLYVLVSYTFFNAVPTEEDICTVINTMQSPSRSDGILYFQAKNTTGLLFPSYR